MKFFTLALFLCVLIVLNAALEQESDEVQEQSRQKRGLLLGLLGAKALGAGVLGAGVLGAGLVGAKVAGGALLGAGIAKGIGIGYHGRPSYYYSGGYRGGYGNGYGGGYGSGGWDRSGYGGFGGEISFRKNYYY